MEPGSGRDWKELSGEFPALAAAWLPCDPDDPVGSGIAIGVTGRK